MANLFDNRPRGIRNNNWLNIKYSPRNRWQGLTGSDGTFCTFETPQYGIRAANKLIHNYLKKSPNMTVEEMVKKWCPDNTAKSYISSVCRYSAVLPYTYLCMFVGNNLSLYVDVITAMAFVECGEKSLIDNFGSRQYVRGIVRDGLLMKI